MTPREVIQKTLEDERDIGGTGTLTGYILRDLVEAGFFFLQWRPIETAPRNGTPILAYEPHREPCVEHAASDETVAVVHWSGRVWADPLYDMTGLDNPTHWMPLPEPPATGAKPESIRSKHGEVT